MATITRPFTESLALKEVGEGQYESLHPPERIGNAQNIAYGGFAVAVAAKASSLTVPPNYFLYTILGSYLGPALTDRTFFASVKTLRQTRTFATRQVEVSQKQEDGSLRACLLAIADFQVSEPAVMEYDIPPARQYSRPEGLSTVSERREEMLKAGAINDKLAAMNKKTFGVLERFYDWRACPEGIFYHTMTGMLKKAKNGQEDVPLTQRTNAEWIRSRHPLSSYPNQIANLGFVMDAAISFAPLVFDHMFLDDVGACSSLDFALRLFRNDFKMEDWHLREIMTKVGSEGRTYTEALIWDENGKCLASMTQQSINRKKVDRKGKL